MGLYPAPDSPGWHAALSWVCLISSKENCGDAFSVPEMICVRDTDDLNRTFIRTAMEGGFLTVIMVTVGEGFYLPAPPLSTSCSPISFNLHDNPLKLVLLPSLQFR